VRNYPDYLDDFDDDLHTRRLARRTRKPQARKEESEPGETLYDLVTVAGDGFNPSFNGSRHEREWILTYLGPFYKDQLITDVLRQVKGGKEATVYCCAAHPSTGVDLLAAKVYRPRMFRNLRNDAQYRQGRALLDDDGKQILDSRTLRAVQKGTSYGQQTTHASWLAHEFATMQLLHASGADVPKPLTRGDNAMLMEYLGDEEMPAPTLNHVTLSREEARPLFERLMRNVELMLSHDRVHGDLSAYNVLYWEGEITIIDFPQVIDAYRNPDAFTLFARDVERLCQYFARYGVATDPSALATQIWTRTMPDETFQVRGARW